MNRLLRPIDPCGNDKRGCKSNSLMQAQHDYLQGNYPVVRDDAAQMCALQMQAECGPNLLDIPDALDAAIEKYVVKQVPMPPPPPPPWCAVHMSSLLPSYFSPSPSCSCMHAEVYHTHTSPVHCAHYLAQ